MVKWRASADSTGGVCSHVLLRFASGIFPSPPSVPSCPGLLFPPETPPPPSNIPFGLSTLLPSAVSETPSLLPVG